MLKINRERLRKKHEKSSVWGIKNHRSAAVHCINKMTRIKHVARIHTGYTESTSIIAECVV